MLARVTLTRVTLTRLAAPSSHVAVDTRRRGSDAEPALHIKETAGLADDAQHRGQAQPNTAQISAGQIGQVGTG